MNASFYWEVKTGLSVHCYKCVHFELILMQLQLVHIGLYDLYKRFHLTL